MTDLLPVSGTGVSDTLRETPKIPRKLVQIVVAAWIGLIVSASIIHASWAVHRAALFLHLVGLVSGFGAVLVVDLHGILWLTGRRRLGDVVLVIRALHPVIWSGLLALTASGMFLAPNLSLPRTGIKLLLVLAAALNGLWASQLSKELSAEPPETPADAVDQKLLSRVMVSGAISQGAWWGATLIGFLATTSR